MEFLYISAKNESEFPSNIVEDANLIAHRGPDNTKVKVINEQKMMVFHRLCINDISDAGSQPMQVGNHTFMCNGEIYNHKDLQLKYDVSQSQVLIVKY